LYGDKSRGPRFYLSDEYVFLVDRDSARCEIMKYRAAMSLR